MDSVEHNRGNERADRADHLGRTSRGAYPRLGKLTYKFLVAYSGRVQENGDFKGKKEATWAVTNLTSGGSAMQVFKLVELGGLKPLCAMLQCADGKIVQVVLDGLTNMLNMADASGKTSEMTTCIEEADAIDMLEKLQEHENEVR